MAFPRKRLFTAILTCSFLLCFGVLIGLFLWGSLQPLSPWMLGFQHRDTDKTRLYFHEGANLTPFDGMDALIARVEVAHGMTFLQKAELVLCESDAEYRRLASTGSRFIVYPKYGRMYVSARALRDAQAGMIHLDTYLAHELSHSLLYQHMALTHVIGFPDWFLEGLAVLNADQRGVDGYLTRDEVRARMRQGYFLHPSDFTTKPWKNSQKFKTFALPDKYWFIYSELACLVEDLIQTGGCDKFLAYENGLMAGKEAETLFQTIYGVSFDEFVADFRKRMTGAATWPRRAGEDKKGCNDEQPAYTFG